eukprot:m.241210 g.241210  ORF g.241210 m.241210 type:complete len:75 (+) comp40202_c0_seq11:1299-1523(+)
MGNYIRVRTLQEDGKTKDDDDASNTKTCFSELGNIVNRGDMHNSSLRWSHGREGLGTRLGAVRLSKQEERFILM